LDGIGDEFKFHLVNWVRIYPFWESDYGRYAMDRVDLWRLMIETKYDSIEGGWCYKEAMGTFGVEVWKHIRSGWDMFSKFVRFEVGDDGSKFSFWHDVWCEDSLLKISYLDLFSIAQRKDAWVANNIQVQEGIIR